MDRLASYYNLHQNVRHGPSDLPAHLRKHEKYTALGANDWRGVTGEGERRYFRILPHPRVLERREEGRTCLQETMKIKDIRVVNDGLLWLTHHQHPPFNAEMRSNIFRTGAQPVGDALQGGESTNPYLESQKKKSPASFNRQKALSVKAGAKVPTGGDADSSTRIFRQCGKLGTAFVDAAWRIAGWATCRTRAIVTVISQPFLPTVPFASTYGFYGIFVSPYERVY